MAFAPYTYGTMCGITVAPLDDPAVPPDRSVGAPRPGKAARMPNRRGDRVAPADFPIVGIGASAGGLEAFSQLLAEIPPDTGMAFVLIQHLDPAHPSYLVEALSK